MYPVQRFVRPFCTLVTTTFLPYEGGWVGHLAPNAFLQSDLLLVHHVGFGREWSGGRAGMGEEWGSSTCLLGGMWTGGRGGRCYAPGQQLEQQDFMMLSVPVEEGGGETKCV